MLIFADAMDLLRTVRPRLSGLSGRLLLLTVVFVLLIEILIIIPTLAAYRTQSLKARVEAAQLAALAVEAAPDGEMLSDTLRRELLANAEVRFALLQRDGRRQLILASEGAVSTMRVIDLRTRNLISSLLETCATLFLAGPDFLRVADTPRLEGGEAIEIIVPSAPLRRDLLEFTLRTVFISVIISALAGLVVYLTLTLTFVRPMRRLAAAMVDFRAAPYDANRIARPSGRRDEIGQAETELAALQTDVRQALHQRERLAALGAAVAKINHDLRNVLTAAQLISDRLASSSDPQTRRSGERLVSAIGRGVRLAQDVLEYGRADEPAPIAADIPLAAMVEDAFADAVAASNTPTGLDVQIDPALALHADPDHTHRIFVNLIRNAVQAVAAQPDRARPGMIAVSAHTDENAAVIRVQDDGPGLPDRVRERLFEPFSGTTRKGGSGLGLSIARELARANGGDVSLAQTSTTGAAFQVCLPLAQGVGQRVGTTKPHAACPQHKAPS